MNKTILSVLSAALAICLAAASACAKATLEAAPTIPVGYYKCMQATPDDLEKAYFSNYGNRDLAEMNYDGQVFVFKKLSVSELALQQYENLGYIWFGVVKCVPLDGGSVCPLKLDMLIDVVGVNQGVPDEPDMKFSLLMTGCVFMPADSLALPAGDAPAFVAGY
jgi:hypothetical protein